MREIYVSRAGDPGHAGDKTLTRETPAKRGRVNRYACVEGFPGYCKYCCFDRILKTADYFLI